MPAMLPHPRTPDPMDAPPLRWGVMGPGWIAERFVRALQEHTRQAVVAVASRSAERAAAFAARWGVLHVHATYEALAADPYVDVVYVATTHPSHHRCALLALEGGKHTLVEKPLALDAGQAREIAAAAERTGRFCAEALWSFFLPRFDVLRQVVEWGVLGELRTVLADHGEHFGPEHRIMRADPAGGPLLDLGTYPVALAVDLLGRPDRVLAAGQPALSGANGQTSVLMAHSGGNQSVLHTTVLSATPTTAVVAGTAATLTLPGPFFMPGEVVVRSNDGRRTSTWTEPPVGHDALHYQAAEVARCVADGRRESPLRPLADSVRTLEVLDAVRRQLADASA